MNIISHFFYAVALVLSVWIASTNYSQTNAETQNAMNLRAQYAEREAFYAAQRTQAIAAVFTDKAGPIAEFGCPVKGGVFMKTKRGKKRIC
jgi:hypothetical protein